MGRGFEAMKKIHVLTPGFTSPNSAAFLFPLIKFKRALKDHGFDIRIVHSKTQDVTDCDALLVDSKYYKSHWSRDFDGTLEDIASLNSKTKLIWCDQADSTGTFLGQVLPHVHRYMKAQLLKDRREYLKTHYASRIFTDYYHKKHGITDADPFIDQPAQNENDLEKLCVSWNSGLMNYGLFGPYIPRIMSKVSFDPLLQFAAVRAKAFASRPQDLTCRMGISYTRETVCYQRRQMRELLKDYVQTDKISRAQYLREISESKICVSPFGLGEITLKDFECFLNGSLLLKPDMNHMDTWPHFYIDGETCLFHNWELDNVQEKIDWALSHEGERISISQNGQDLYEAYTTNVNAPVFFAQHFSNIFQTLK